jgi:hypothetical protein
MFTWICPTCGRECPPAYTECPDCAGKAPAPAVETAAAAVSTQPPAVPPPAAPRPAAPGIPTWLLSVVFALAFFGLGAGVYFVSQHFRNKSQAAAPAAQSPQPAFETPQPASPAVKQHPYLKYIQITGWRLLQDARKRPEIRFIVVNHSGAEIPDINATVNLRARAGTETEPIGSFSFKLPSLGPYESRDLSAPLNTKLKVYEFPDWQNLFEEIQIASPDAK